ncbi:hypothetical protein FKM82_026691 [Ascaphus truei]
MGLWVTHQMGLWVTHQTSYRIPSVLPVPLARKSIRATFKSREQAAVLTTHYMEEAEAVCDRVAIMVSGQLRCIGSVQHLKSKFGRDYSLDMKLEAEAEKLELLHKEIVQIFPNASRQDR